MEKTEYQIKSEKIIEERKLISIDKHKKEKLAKKEMTLNLKPIKRRIRDNRKRMSKIQQKVHEDVLLCIKIRGEGI